MLSSVNLERVFTVCIQLYYTMRYLMYLMVYLHNTFIALYYYMYSIQVTITICDLCLHITQYKYCTANKSVDPSCRAV
jgi:hypothetical protein